jgi:hypothetical protein
VSAPSAPSSPEMVRGLQERAVRALPAEHVEHVGGWWLCHAPSCDWWVGTVLPHGDAEPGELVRRVVGVEKFYAGYEAAAWSQISPRACPPGLDTLLAERGRAGGDGQRCFGRACGAGYPVSGSVTSTATPPTPASPRPPENLTQTCRTQRPKIARGKIAHDTWSVDQLDDVLRRRTPHLRPLARYLRIGDSQRHAYPRLDRGQD